MLTQDLAVINGITFKKESLCHVVSERKYVNMTLFLLFFQIFSLFEIKIRSYVCNLAFNLSTKILKGSPSNKLLLN